MHVKRTLLLNFMHFIVIFFVNSNYQAFDINLRSNKFISNKIVQLKIKVMRIRIRRCLHGFI